MKRIRSFDDGNDDIASTHASRRNSPTPQTPNLNLSRENTPFLEDLDHSNNTTGKGVFNSDVSADEGSVYNNLDLSRAQKRLSESVPRIDTIKRKVTAKAIEKNWVPLDKECLKSFSELSSNALSKVKDQLQNSSNRQAKILEMERIISGHWTSETLPKSFLTRLKITKLPLIKSLPIKTRDSLDVHYKCLEVEQVETRKAQLEESLRTELKELEKLETYFNTARKLLDLDQEYLAEFQKTKSEVKSQLEQEIQENRDKYKLHISKDSTNDVKLYNEPKLDTTGARNFDPEEDPQVSKILKKLNNSISAIGPTMHKFQKHTERLKLIEQKLVSQESK